MKRNFDNTGCELFKTTYIKISQTFFENKYKIYYFTIYSIGQSLKIKFDIV